MAQDWQAGIRRDGDPDGAKADARKPSTMTKS